MIVALTFYMHVYCFYLKETCKQPMDTNCFICRKHEGLEALPPGGYIYENEH